MLKSIKLLSIILLATLNFSKGANVFISDKSDAVVDNQQSVETKLVDQKKLYSDKKLGSFVEAGKTYFNLFAPNAKSVQLVIFENVEHDEGETHQMIRDENGVWEFTINEELYGKYYGYKVLGKNDQKPIAEKQLCVDPYAKAVASYTTYYNPRKSIVFNDSYDWGNDNWIQRDWRDLIIYEMHIRDMTAHKTSGAESPGTYKGLVENNITGGVNYIKELGVNTVELLPAMEFGYCEIPFKDSLNGKYNTWNPYERNHWGYMTAGFFAPSSYYAMDWQNFEWNGWMGADGNQVNEFKDMVKAFHKEGIGVMMDVVYNHLSEYELGNLKQIDREYYFRLNDDGSFAAQSGCGNDLKTENPMVRRMIVESILYWMKEYHIDGFRFDLGKLIDWETIEEVIREAKKINPNVIFVCEPWGGGYDPKGFSLREWGSWNDQIRNGIKGENPLDGLGWIFGKWYGNNNVDRIKSYVNGTLISYKHGLFQKKEHSVNYLESHDGYTLGDFIRIGTNEVDPEEIIKDVDKHVKLSPHQLKLNKLAALFLLTSQGITMIHSGQEFARSKVIPYDIPVMDKHKGMMDHNSYEKDNETNYINYDHVEINKDLYDYYKGLIQLRSKHEAFRHADTSDVAFFRITDNEFTIGYRIEFETSSIIVLMNANQNQSEEFTLPEGNWSVLVDASKAGTEALYDVEKSVELEPVTGMVLIKNRD